MDTNALFIQATRERFRYKSNQGDLTTEDLWRLPLTSTTGRDLDAVAILAHRHLMELTQESFVKKDNPGRKVAEAKLEIIKAVIDYKQTEEEKKVKSAQNKQQKDLLLEILAKKQNEKLLNASEEEILKQLQALEVQS